MEWLGALFDWAASREVVLWWLFAASLAMFLLTPLVVGWTAVRLPRDYFTARRRRPAPWIELYPALRPVLVIAKNLLGVVLVVAGLVMLVVPGQGLLTMVVGLVLVDFPGKYRLEALACHAAAGVAGDQLVAEARGPRAVGTAGAGQR